MTRITAGPWPPEGGLDRTDVRPARAPARGAPAISRRPAGTACLAALALALSVFPAPIDAQGPPDSKEIPASKVERKNLAPVSKEVLRVALPRPAIHVLDNGVAVLLIEDHRLPTVQFRVQIGGAGPIHEPPGLPGLASLAARMLTEGTATRSSERLAREIESAGAEISASAPFGSTDASIAASGLSDNLDEWLGLVADVLLRPSFPAGEFDKLKQRTRAQLKQQRASPRFLCQEQFSRSVFGAHPAAVVSATEAALDVLTPQDLAAWHRERYIPPRVLLGVAGDVRAEHLIPKLNRLTADWQSPGGPEIPPTRPEKPASRRLLVVDRPASVQASLVLGGLALDRRDPDYIPLLVMNRILGGSSAARLFLNLREEKGYTYGVYSYFTAVKYPGAWQAVADVRTEVTGAAVAELLKELTRIREEPVPVAELKEAQRSIVAAFALSIEQPARLLEYALVRAIYEFPEDYWDRYPSQIMAVTPDEVRRVARKYLDLDTMQVVAVGDASKIRPVLERLGPVILLDTAGRPQKLTSPKNAPD